MLISFHRLILEMDMVRKQCLYPWLCVEERIVSGEYENDPSKKWYCDGWEGASSVKGFVTVSESV